MSEVRGFDFHCHVDLHRDPPQLIKQCEVARIATIAVTTTPKAWPQNKRWTSNSSYVFPAVGLHPELVGERYGDLELLEKYMNDTRLVGEVGLDGSPQHRRHFVQQQEVFERVLKIGQSLGGRVLTIHSRRAATEVIKMIKGNTTPDRVLPILHWFSGSTALARRAVECGCYFSINSSMLDHDHGQTLVRSLPTDRLITETDSPFTKVDGRNSLPWDVIRAADRLSALLRISIEETARLLARNAAHVLMFAGIAETAKQKI